MQTRLTDQAAQNSGLSQAELERLSTVARQAATAGALELKRLFGRLERIREKGRAGDLVTEADVAAEQAVLTVLSEATPELGVLAEESGRKEGQGSDLQWCVDPLDGTTNYAHGYPFFGTSIGLTWRGQPLLGALAVPALDRLYWAAPGLGAWCNDAPIQVSRCTSLGESLLVTGFAYDRHTRLDNNYAEFAYFTHRTRGVRRGGAAAPDAAGAVREVSKFRVVVVQAGVAVISKARNQQGLPQAGAAADLDRSVVAPSPQTRGCPIEAIQCWYGQGTQQGLTAPGQADGRSEEGIAMGIVRRSIERVNAPLQVTALPFLAAALLGQHPQLGGGFAQHRQHGLLGGDIGFGDEVTGTALFADPLQASKEPLQFEGSGRCRLAGHRAETLQLGLA